MIIIVLPVIAQPFLIRNFLLRAVCASVFCLFWLNLEATKVNMATGEDVNRERGKLL